MPEGSVRFTLDDGETLIVPDDELRQIYDTLWERSREPGAVSTAALLIEASRLREALRPKIELTTSPSNALRQAVARLHAKSPSK
jgi:hypothetical protein